MSLDYHITMGCALKPPPPTHTLRVLRFMALELVISEEQTRGLTR